MATIKNKFSLGQSVSVIKSGKAGVVESIVIDKNGLSVDVRIGNAKRPWRYPQSALQSQAEADKAAKAKAKAAKPAPAPKAKATPVPAPAKPAPKAKAVKPAAPVAKPAVAKKSKK